jgi:hypothetical protein
MSIVELFSQELARAEAEHRKMAVFHSLVLIHATELDGHDPLEFCRSVGLTDAYQTEFRKMISVAKLLPELGVALTRKDQ